MARRHRALSEEIAKLDAHIERLVEGAAPGLVAPDGVGPDTAAAHFVVAGDNPERLGSEGAFAHLCGTASVQASSGKIVRHRLNPGGNCDANRALHVMVLNRLRRDPRSTSPGAPPRTRPRRRPCAASSAPSPARSTARC